MIRILALISSLLFYSAPAQAQNACNMQLGGPPIFCDTFDTKNAGTPSRTGELDPNVWGVSRTTGSVNFGQGFYNGWATTLIRKCDGTTSIVSPPNDIIICNGQLREASNDNQTRNFEAGTITALTMYPKQPFDFAGRVGTVSFDIGNDTHGSHAAWPEFWLSNLPVPAPFSHAGWQSLPQHGLGIRFHASAEIGQWGICQNGNNLDKRRWTVGSAVIVRNYVMDDTEGGGIRTNMAVQQLDCVIAPPDDSVIMNHVEIRIAQNQIDIYATDAGVAPSPATLRRIAVVSNANLTLTRGLIWLEDVHYNADKGELPSQREHTFVWDKVAFDGPFTFRDFSYDALDNTTLTYDGAVNLGKLSNANQTSSWDVLGIPANPQAAAVRVLFNFLHQDNGPATLNVIVNGHAHPTPWPYPDTGSTWRTFAVTIPITDLVPGTNVVQIGSTELPIVTSNVNIVLVQVPGGVPVLPGSNNAYPVQGQPPVAVNGACGPANGTTVSAPPMTGLCSSGLATAVSGVGPWTWSCTGSNGGTTASCSANKTATTPVNGVCGSANGVAVTTTPTTNLCAVGASSAVSGTGPWSWTCAGSNGGTQASCAAPLSAAETCSSLLTKAQQICR